MGYLIRGIVGLLAGWGIVAHAAAPPIEAFAAMPRIRNVALSPSGKQIVFITGLEDRSVAVVSARDSLKSARPIMRSEPGEFELSWCQWANEKRLLCSALLMMKQAGRVYPATRLVGVNADGSEVKVLMQGVQAVGSQFQDQILDWTPDNPESVLIQVDEDLDGFPSVYEMNVQTGMRSQIVSERRPVRTFQTDAKGNVRLGFGYTGTTLQYLARLENDREWQRLAKVEVFQANDALAPIAIAPGTNRAFAFGAHEGRTALWEIDLADAKGPELVFSHPLVDVESPVLAGDGRLVGIWYELDRPFIHYVDESVRTRMLAINKLLPATFNYVTDYTVDEKVFVIRSYSDVDAGTYSVFDVEAKKLVQIGTSYPGLDPQQLGRMRTITYKASDGVEIPGYLTVPVGVRAENLPLIVMPHGGPIARDSWDFFFLRAFLVSRGYAVLQMNFRGSSGYGWEWFAAAHQDWGGLTYSDIHDGAMWAIKEGIADPKRVAIVGWSFGGYAALLGATRNSDVYKCSVSIAGVSDLPLLLREARFFSNYKIAREQIGTNWEKLKGDSPLRHVDNIKVPVLLVHGTSDYQVESDHTAKMASALKRAKKPHKSIIIKDATHQLDRKSDRVTLLSEIEAFLKENLGPGVPAGS